MTEQNLDKGRDILKEMFDLKKALSFIRGLKLFDVYEDHCSNIDYPFLADLEIRLKKIAADNIQEKINFLKSQFEKL